MLPDPATSLPMAFGGASGFFYNGGEDDFIHLDYTASVLFDDGWVRHPLRIPLEGTVNHNFFPMAYSDGCMALAPEGDR